MEGHVRYRRISDEDRERLVTARSIVATYLRTGRRHKLHRGGAKNQKMDDEMRARIQRIIDVNPLVTLQQNQERSRGGTSSKANCYHLNHITSSWWHVHHPQTGRRCAGCTKRTTKPWSTRGIWPVVLGGRGGGPYSIHRRDRGYNVWPRRSYGRAQRGQPVRRVVHRQRGKRCNVTFAVSGEVGLVHHEISCETVTRASFEDFLAETARQCAIVFPPGEPVVLIYDNVRPHVRARLPPDVDPAIQLGGMLMPSPRRSAWGGIAECKHTSHYASPASILMAEKTWQRNHASLVPDPNHTILLSYIIKNLCKIMMKN